MTFTPAAADTLARFLADTRTTPRDYDLILTGDLSAIGAELFCDLMQRRGVHLGDRYNDCGLLLYDRDRQDVHAGGSGCGCSGAVVCSHILHRMQRHELERVVFLGTGALLSPVSAQQGESIPGIAHLVLLSNE